MIRSKIPTLVTGFLLMALQLPEHQAPAAPETSAQGIDSCQAANFTFQNGEKLTYKIFYNWNFVWLSAGEVTFKVFDEDKQWHYQAYGKTYPSYEWFFKVQDQYDSWVNKSTLLPNYSERSVNEGNYHIFEKISFNQSTKKMSVWRAPQKGGEEKKTEHNVTDCVHDILSSLYYLRNIDLTDPQSGNTVPFRIFMDQAEYPLKLRFKGRDGNKNVHGMGRYKVLKYQPDVIAGSVFKEDTKMTVWVSDDENRIPVLIESPVSVGSVKMVLKEYWGLRYDFKAKVK
ncbi:MAG: DUF3108 domain-containing protein [Saprospiraceae bacterium]|nr:DUF3108 domain-containing protein [Saprospiraceae bacterium]